MSDETISTWHTILTAVLGHPDAAQGLDETLRRNSALLAQATATDLPATILNLVAEGLERMGSAEMARLAATLPRHLPPPPARLAVTAGMLPRLSPEGIPGVSLVTCCGNRTENLLRALPSWIAQDSLSEIVIVDWSSRIPVAQSLAGSGIADPRIRILRVEGEPDWILTHAFNVGFRAASCDTILKADADIVLAPDIFTRNLLVSGGFLAGNWRGAGEGQAYVNGFFLVSRAALAEVGGFNEQIRGYGWDDEDLYLRLMQLGLRRIDVAPGSVTHLDHDDAARGLAEQPATPGTALEQARQGTVWMIRRNRYIAAVMPEWNGRRAPAAFRVVQAGPRTATLRREPPDTSAPPLHVLHAAETHATIERAAWHLGPEIREMPPDEALRLLDRPLTRLDVVLARHGRPDLVGAADAPLLLRIDAEVLSDPRPETSGVLQAVADRARALGLLPVVQVDDDTLPEPIAAAMGNPPVLPATANLGPTTNLLPRLLFEDQPPAVEGVPRLRLTAEAVQRIGLLVQRRQARSR